jgi:hypothetical protein
MKSNGKASGLDDAPTQILRDILHTHLLRKATQRPTMLNKPRASERRRGARAGECDGLGGSKWSEKQPQSRKMHL